MYIIYFVSSLLPINNILMIWKGDIRCCSLLKNIMGWNFEMLRSLKTLVRQLI